MRKLRILLLFIIAWNLGPIKKSEARVGNTYWVSTTGTSNTTCSQTVTCNTAAAIALVGAGDTINVLDGTYTGALNMITITSKSGTPTSRITFKAVNDGKVLFDGQRARYPFITVSMSYWDFSGFNVAHSIGDGILIQTSSSFNTFKRICAWDADYSGNSHVWDIYAGSSNNLLEDVAGWGTGRKIFQFYQDANNNIIRRAFAESNYTEDMIGAGTPFQPYTISYNSYGNIAENVIGMYDMKRSTTIQSPGDLYGLLGVDRLSEREPNVSASPKYYGSIGILLTSQILINYDNGICYGGADIAGMGWKDDICYVVTGAHAGVNALNLPAWGNGNTINPVNAPNPPGRGTFQNFTVIAARAIFNSCLTGGTNCWTNLGNYVNATTLAGAYGAQSLWVNDGTHGATICKQYNNGSGTVSSVPLWPWPMNQRIIDAMGTYGTFPAASVVKTLTPMDVTATMEATFGAIPAACRNDTIVAISPTEPFTYTAGSNLSPLNGGINFATPWSSVGSGAITVETAPAGMHGTAARSLSNTGTVDYRRSFFSLTQQGISWLMRTDKIPSGSTGVYTLQDSNPLFSVEFEADGTITAHCLSGAIALQTYTINTTYTIKATIDSINHPGQFQIAITGGVTSDWLTSFNSQTAVNGVGLEDLSTDSSTLYIDDFGTCSATQLGIATQPASSVGIGANLGTVAILPLCSDGVSVDLSTVASVSIAKTGATCSGMTLNGTTTANFAGGVANFSTLNLTGSTGNCTLTATVSGLSTVVTNTITVTSFPTTNPNQRVRVRKR